MDSQRADADSNEQQVTTPHNVILIIADDYGIEMSQLYTTAADLKRLKIFHPRKSAIPAAQNKIQSQPQNTYDDQILPW